MKRIHGKHNKIVCDSLYLQEKLKCNDWVVTTAFYSSIHFLDHILFPFKYSDAHTFNDINEAHRAIAAKSKHQTRAVLISKHPILKKQADNYNYLISESQNARYVNYDIHDLIAKGAVDRLNHIIKECDIEK